MKSDVWTNFDFTAKALMISNSSYPRNFQMKIDINGKIGSYAKLCMQNKILASKMQNLKQQKTSVFAPLILKRWIGTISGRLAKAFAILLNKESVHAIQRHTRKGEWNREWNGGME